MGFGDFIEFDALQQGLESVSRGARDFLNGRELGPDEDMLSREQSALEQALAGVGQRMATSFGDFTGGYQPHAVKTCEIFADKSHEDLKARVEQMSPEKVAELSETWKAISKRADEHLAAFRPRILNAIQEKWEGESASAAAQGITDYVGQSHQLTQATGILASKLEALNAGLIPTKSNMPDVPQASVMDRALSFAPGPTWQKVQHEKDAAHAEAVRVLQTVYTPAVMESDTQVPIIPQPHNPVTGSGGTGTPGGPNGSPSTTQFGPWGAGSTPGGGLSGSGSDGQYGPGSDSLASNPGSVGTEGQPGNEALTANGNNGSGDPSQTGAQSLDPANAATSPASAADGSGGDSAQRSGAGSTAGNSTGTGGSTTGGSHAGTGAGGGFVPSALGQNGTGGSRSLGSAGGSGSSPGGGGLTGRNLTGGSVGGAASGTGAGISSPTAGRAGAPGMGGMGMMPPGARGKGDDDDEHKTPSYLINVDNGNELIGDMPKVAPPVIGG